MKADKRKLLIEDVPMLDWCLLTAQTLDDSVNLLTTDFRSGQGPLAGIETGLMESDSAIHLFLSCDMPFVSSQTILDIKDSVNRHGSIVCMEVSGQRGFPIAIAGKYLSFVTSQLNSGRRTLYSLFHHPCAKAFCWAEEDRMEATNVNTPEEFTAAKEWASIHRLAPPITARQKKLIEPSPAG